MSFSIGDKVICIKSNRSFLPNKTGTILHISYNAQNQPAFFTVQWDNWNNGHNGNNIIPTDTVTDNSVWNVLPDEIQKKIPTDKKRFSLKGC